MPHVKVVCEYCPPPGHKHPFPGGPRDWEMHPSWIAGMEAFHAYGDWVSSIVLPIAFQWIEEHKAEVYASVPEELKEKFRNDPRFKRAFEALTPGRQRGYLFHFAGAKQSRTRTARIEKAMPAIFEGRGFLERR